MTFIDTNVLVYAVDGRDSEKQQAAMKFHRDLGMTLNVT